jgi:hypothetical protein
MWRCTTVAQFDTHGLLLTNPVAIEKLTHPEFAEIRSRQEALQTIFSDLLDTFDPLIFGFVQKN